jgi:hypothetical protein
MALTKTKLIADGAVTAETISSTVNLGGPKITTVNVANSTYAVLDDTAVNVGGGYLVITGSGFASGCQVIIDDTNATSTTFVNTSTLRAQVPAKTAATYNLYVANPDGGTALKVNGLTYSGIPTWVTASTLANVISNTAFTGSLSATGATSYANTTALPTGFNLVTANGYYFGNISVGSATTYSFTIEARDAELQDSPRTFSLTTLVSNAPTTVEYLVVAGGGGGGGHFGGGGGAGGYKTGNLSVSFGTTYTVTVGGGGTVGSAYNGSVSTRGANGSNSVLSSITSIGGGGGGTRNGDSVGLTGGSGGGGGGWTGSAGGTGTAGQGNSGGAGNPEDGNFPGGGGGGAGANGSTGASGSAGGSGSNSSITGTSTAYAGGGGGGSRGGSIASGGLGGGGNGASSGSAATAAATNTGGGGGGAGASDEGKLGSNGGSGIVIIRYSDTLDLATSTTGSPTVTTSGGYKIYQFTGSGSITW